jgi:tetratricopeptide (TPR) repeat protein
VEVFWKEVDTPDILAWRGGSEGLRAHCLWFTDEKAATDTAQLALDCLKRVIAEEPIFDNIAGVYYDAARLSNVLSNAPETVEFCEKCLQCELRERERLQCLIVLSEALRQSERFTEAENALKEAFKLAKSDVAALPRLFMEIGIVKRSTILLEDARHFFHEALRALESHPYSSNDSHYLTIIHGNLGELSYESKNYEDAVAAFQKVLSLHPVDNPERRNALLWLGQTYHCIRTYDDARRCYEQILDSSLATEAERASAQEGLGKVYYDQGHYEKAVATFEETIKVVPEDSSFRCNLLLSLGYSYHALGSDTKARECFEKVVASGSASESEVSSAQDGLSRLPSSPKTTVHRSGPFRSKAHGVSFLLLMIARYQLTADLASSGGFSFAVTRSISNCQTKNQIPCRTYYLIRFGIRPASISAFRNGSMPPAANFLMIKGGRGSNLSSTPEEMLMRVRFRDHLPVRS